VRLCSQCGLSIGDTATFCQVCGALVDPLPTDEGQAASDRLVPLDVAQAAPDQLVALDGTPAAPVVIVGHDGHNGGPAGPEESSDGDLTAAGAPDEALDEPAGPPVADLDLTRLDIAAQYVAAAKDCEKTDPGRAVALYRQAIVDYLGCDDDPLALPGVGGRLVFVFNRLSLALKRSDLQGEALEEIDSAAALGLLDRDDFGARREREALTKRAAALRAAAPQAPR